MDNPLSIKAGNEELEIKANKADYAAALIRGIVGVAPVVGPMTAELLTTRIPNQKLDRVIVFMRVLEDRLKYVEEDLLRSKFVSEEFADLLEDALPQVSRALSDERKAYIANFLATSLTEETLDHLAEKRLLSLLNELNDAEIVLLHFYALRITDRQKADEMVSRYPFIKTALMPYSPVQSEIEEEVMFRDYKGKLVMTNLTLGTGEYERPTALGKLLLRYIGAEKEIA